MPLGQSFAPLGSDDISRREQGGGPISPVQESIQTLSLRLPRFISGGSPVPRALLAGLGGNPGIGSAALPAASPEPNPVEEWIRRMMGISPAPSGLSGGTTRQPTGPSVTMGGIPYQPSQPSAPVVRYPDPAIHYQEPSAPEPTMASTYEAPREERIDVRRSGSYYPDSGYTSRF